LQRTPPEVPLPKATPIDRITHCKTDWLLIKSGLRVRRQDFFLTHPLHCQSHYLSLDSSGSRGGEIVHDGKENDNPYKGKVQCHKPAVPLLL